MKKSNLTLVTDTQPETPEECRIEAHIKELLKFKDTHPEAIPVDVTTLLTYDTADGDSDTVILSRASTVDLHLMSSMVQAATMDKLRGV